MNEVYSRGGLSSYALFLLVLTTVHYYPLVATYPPDEILGRYLVEFLKYWSSPDAVMEVIRPLKSPLQKGWPELYQPYGLCMPSSFVMGLMTGILDPVNEENWIGGATFSIREIQEEWGLSFTALGVAIEEFTGNINGGREKSLLASIVGLTTRYLIPCLAPYSDLRDSANREGIRKSQTNQRLSDTLITGCHHQPKQHRRNHYEIRY